MEGKLKLLFLSAAAALSLTATAAFAGPEANINRCWGELAAHMGQNGIMGKHSSSHGFFTPDPGEGGRRGVGNVSKEEHGPLPEGGQGHHAIEVGHLLGADFLKRLGLPEGDVDAIDCSVAPD